MHMAAGDTIYIREVYEKGVILKENSVTVVMYSEDL